MAPSDIAISARFLALAVESAALSLRRSCAHDLLSESLQIVFTHAEKTVKCTALCKSFRDSLWMLTHFSVPFCRVPTHPPT